MDIGALITQITGVQKFSLEAVIYVMARFSGIFIEAPLLSNRNFPLFAKIGMIVILSLVVLPFVPQSNFAPATNDMIFLLNIGKELLTGLLFAFVIRLIFIAIQIAGQLIDYQIGFGFVNIVDPESNVQVPIVGQYLIIMITFVFLIMNAHHLVIRGLAESFNVIPLAGAGLNYNIMEKVNILFGGLFTVGFKIASPIILPLFLVDVAYGVIARAVPQANILVVGFPLKIGMGLVFLFMSLSLTFILAQKLIHQVLSDSSGILRMLSYR